MNFEEFYKKYHLQLNDQQLEAVKAVKGPTLLLAVPGSGKTTVLVNRLGYMVYCCSIVPEKILTLTYTVAATKDMGARFRMFFGNEMSSRMEFRTINGICASILYYYGKTRRKTMHKLVTEEKETAHLLSGIFRQVEGGFATESDLKNVRTWISYIKNMMLNPEEIEALNEEAECNIAQIYALYNQGLKKEGLMDYDDQMRHAYMILRGFPDVLNYYQEKYQYICVDEAQDTSKIQHAIIALLANKHQNLFMVGDEDQSIYGFRAAYPEALLSFEKRHPSAKVLLMERNYRSNAKIVSAADQFIQKNTMRHEKHMRAVKEAGADIRKISIKGRSAQYRYLQKVADGCSEQTAVLYRHNESVLPLVDLLERENIPYQMRNADLTFFTNRVVLDIQNIIRFAMNPSDTDLFQQIYYKISTYINKKDMLEICRLSRERQIPVLETAIRYGRLSANTISSCKKINTHLANLLSDKADYAIQRIVQYMGYGDYLERVDLSDSKLFILRTLARQEENAESFVERLNRLHQIIREKESDTDCPFILSTIHASKGLEYNTVYLMDVSDGIFPENIPAKGQKIEQAELTAYEEERRIFYVGVTRAKNQLCIFQTSIGSIFCRELLKEAEPQPKAQKMSYEKTHTFEKKPYQQPKKTFSEEEYRQYISELGEGLVVEHKIFGKGVITSMTETQVTIQFEDSIKTLGLKMCYQNQLLK
jgi:DNA helicase-2/ATP-dependent DNA helicase PcrA